jgi:predicted DNA-binding transcriptional regulator AlpA
MSQIARSSWRNFMAKNQPTTSAQPTENNAPIVAKSMRIDPALLNFDSLPNSAFVRINVVLALFACSRATVWRHVKTGSLPAPVKSLGKISAWNVGSLRNHLNQMQ